jgi:hypothetical protein
MERALVRIVGLALVVSLSALAACGGGPDVAPCAGAAEVSGLRLNQIQVVGSHNSFRRRTYQPLFALAQALRSMLPPELDPDGLDYDHVPIGEQLERYGVRALELDLYNDPAGGQYYHRRGLDLVGEPTASNIPALLEPGMKPIHIPDFDYETNHYTFRSALEAVRAWSDAHPRHLPLFIQLETKDFSLADVVMQPGLTLTPAIPFDAAAADALDGEIRAVLTDPRRIITPAEVRGAHPSLESAVLASGWPLVEASRGRVLFFMQGSAVDEYLAPSPDLSGRLMFVTATPGQAHAAVVLENDVLANEAGVADLVRRGYIVRTRADADTREARSGDRSRLDAALRSGAQIVSTDYYRPDPRGGQEGSGWTRYAVGLPGGGPGRTNTEAPAGGAGGGRARLCE